MTDHPIPIASEGEGLGSYSDPSQLSASGREDAPSKDGREPDYTREGIFVYHDCWKCQHGAKPCPHAGAHRCEYPHARND